MIEHLNIFVTINNECEERVNKLMNIVSKLQELSGQSHSWCGFSRVKYFCREWNLESWSLLVSQAEYLMFCSSINELCLLIQSVKLLQKFWQLTSWYNTNWLVIVYTIQKSAIIGQFYHDIYLQIILCEITGSLVSHYH